MGFTLKLQYAHDAFIGEKYWWAEYDMGVYSGWLDIDETWNCIYGAYNATDLAIYVADADWSIFFQDTNLGPIQDGKAYKYDCINKRLKEITSETLFSALRITEWSRR